MGLPTHILADDVELVSPCCEEEVKEWKWK